MGNISREMETKKASEGHSKNYKQCNRLKNALHLSLLDQTSERITELEDRSKEILQAEMKNKKIKKRKKNGREHPSGTISKRFNMCNSNTKRRKRNGTEDVFEVMTTKTILKLRQTPKYSFRKFRKHLAK